MEYENKFVGLSSVTSHDLEILRYELDELLNMSSHSTNIAHSIYGLSECDEEFKTKFKQLLNETKQRLQKEFDEL